MTLTKKIIIALIVGLFFGVILKTPIWGVEIIGRAFVMLLQMTAIPYICVSLICGIGYLDKDSALKLVKFGLIIYLSLVLIFLIFSFFTGIAFPNWTASSFYSTSILPKNTTTDYLSLFIPNNPFFSLSNNHVPAIVLFCVFLGIGFMGVEFKNQSLLLMKDIQQSLVNVNNLILRAAPLGVFCIAQHAAAILGKGQLDGLFVYMVTATFLSLLLTFIVFPGIIAIFTPFSYKDIMQVSKDALLTAFVTGHILVVIPLIAEKIKHLANEITPTIENEHNLAEVVAPISFSFPTGSKLLSICFIIFAAWFDGQPFDIPDAIKASSIGFMYLFSSNYTAVPEILSIMNISASLFDIFVIAENLFIRHINALVGAMFCITLTLLTTICCMGFLDIKIKKLFVFSLFTFLISVSFLFTINLGFEAISHQYQGYTKFIDRKLFFSPAKNNIITINQLHDTEVISQNTLERIQKRGVLRFGYYPDALPYAFNNKGGDLVGFDIELIHLLARELKVNIEFVKLSRDQTADLIKTGGIDLASGVPLITGNLSKFTLSLPYSEETIALVVKNEKRNKFKSLSQLQKLAELSICVPENFFYKEVLNEKFSNATINILSSPRQFFQQENLIDAMVFGAAGASAWTLVYPQYTVVIPKPSLSKVPISFIIPPNDPTFELFIRNWIMLNKKNGTIRSIFSYWIEGKNPQSKD